ncbi:MAG TPA: hypothetical protein VGN16_09515 [Acidobacteriaceae bacterium]|jgi:hypothetical protein
MTKSIILGCKAKDRVSGFSGIVTSHHEEFTGMIQWGITPPVDKKKPGEAPDGLTFDHEQVAYVGVGLNVKPKKFPQMGFKLGDEVEDRVSGYRGIATFRSDFMNGCTNVSVQAKIKPGDEFKKGKGFPLQSLKRVGAGINDPKEAPITPAPKGGPSQKVSEF